MALTPISVSPYPNVPDLPGVPALARLAATVVPLPVLAVADMVGLSFGTPQWGLFTLAGTPYFIVDTIVSVELEADADVPKYPQEAGAFQNYNKVQMPFTAKITMATSGSQAKRQAFIAALQAAKDSLTLYSVVMPEYTFQNVTVNHYEFDRSAQGGVSLITATIWITEVRLTATSTTSSTASPNGAAAQSGGTVQTIPVTVQQLPPISAAGAQ